MISEETYKLRDELTIVCSAFISVQPEHFYYHIHFYASGEKYSEIITFDHFMWAVLPLRLRTEEECTPNWEEQNNFELSSDFFLCKCSLDADVWKDACILFYNVNKVRVEVNKWIEMDAKMITNF